MSPLVEKFLAKNKAKFASADGFPAAFHREALFDQIQVGKTVGILTPQGNVRTGRATIPNKEHRCFVLNGGGAHGTPIIASPENTIFVSGARI